MIYNAVREFDSESSLRSAMTQLKIISQVVRDRMQSSDGIQYAPVKPQCSAQGKVDAVLELSGAQNTGREIGTDT